MRTYRESGVDQRAADDLIPLFAKHAARTFAGGEVGGFAGLIPLSESLALAMSTDTVGTKSELLARAGLHATAGWDAVAMNVDDVVCSGARPLAVVDCIAIERLEPAVAEQIVSGVADACIEAGCALVGGETAQLPGLLREDMYEVMVACVGTVDPRTAWGSHLVRAGDALVGLPSSGPHSNGFSLIRRLLGEDEKPPEALLEPTAIYCRKLLAAVERADVHAASHITGGGIAGNVERVLPDDLGATIRMSAWRRPEVFDWIASRGVSEDEMRAVFNLGLGMVVFAPDGGALCAALRAEGVDAFVVGEVTREPGVRLV